MLNHSDSTVLIATVMVISGIMFVAGFVFANNLNVNMKCQATLIDGAGNKHQIEMECRK